MCKTCPEKATNPAIRVIDRDLVVDLQAGRKFSLRYNALGETHHISDMVKDLPAQQERQEQINTDVTSQFQKVNAGLETKAGSTDVTDEIAAASRTASDNLVSAKAELNTKIGAADSRITNHVTAANDRLAKIEANIKALQSESAELKKLKADLSAQKLLETRVAALEDVKPASGVNLVKGSDLKDTAGAGWDTPIDDSNLIFDTFIDGLPIRAMKSIEKGKSCYTWGRTNMFKIDPTSSYEFSIWVKSASKHQNAMSNYFGYYVYDENKKQIRGAHDNPYFLTNRNDGGEWGKAEGYLLGKDFNQMQGTNGYNRKVSIDSMYRVNDANARYAILRYGACYAEGDDNDETWFTMPSVREMSSARDFLGSLHERSFVAHNKPYSNLVRHSNLLATDKGVARTEKWEGSVSNLVLTHFQSPGGPAFPIVAAYSKEGNTGGCYGGWGHTNMVPINPNKRYEFSIWIKSNDANMNNYFGFHVYDGNKNRIGNEQVNYGNPYFKCRDNDPEAWTQYFGYLGGEAHHNNQCGDNSYNTGGTRLASWRLQSNVKWATLRFGSCYAGGNSQGTTMYAFPKITELLVT